MKPIKNKLVLFVIINIALIISLFFIFNVKISKTKEEEYKVLASIYENFKSENVSIGNVKNEKLALVIESIDTLIHKSIIRTELEGYNILNKEIAQLYLFHDRTTPACELGTRLIELYETNPDRYKILKEQFNFNTSMDYLEYFKDKRLIEVLFELSSLKSQLLLLEQCSITSTNSSESPH